MIRNRLSMIVALGIAACNNGPSPNDAAMSSGDTGAMDTGSTDASSEFDGGLLPPDFFAPFTPPFDMTTSTPGTVQVSLSAEALGELGYTYNSAPAPDDPVFVDGWSVQFEHYIVVVGSVTISQQGSDPSMRAVVGTTVAHRSGPWIVDGHRHGTVAGAGGAPETANPMFVFTGPDAGGSFDTSTQYAFSFETGPAVPTMTNVNLVEADRTIVEQMVTHGWDHYVAGTATYAGRVASTTVDPDFQSYPTSVHFAFGFGAPSQYINCHNPEIGDMDIPANWGIRPSATGAVRAQLTFHTDHSFWDTALVEGTPLRFDAYAARVQDFGTGTGSHELSLDDLVGVSPAALMDRSGSPVTDRADQTTGYTPDMGVPPVYSLNGATGITDLRDWFAYLTRTQGHLNSDGLCFVQPSGSFAY